MARCLVVQHAEPEPAGAFGDALAALGIDVDVRRVHDGDALPADLDAHHGLLVMGGPMAAHLDDGFASRGAELALLAQSLRLGMPTLGVCLGAQLLALAGGGEVFPGPTGPEIGWAPVHLTTAGNDDALLRGLPAELEVLHWHGDTFWPGPSSVLLASSQRYPAQAFRSGEAAWGLQFHIEVDEAQVAGFVAAWPGDAARAPEGAEGVVRRAAPSVRALRPHVATVAGRFAALVARRGRSRLGGADVL